MFDSRYDLPSGTICQDTRWQYKRDQEDMQSINRRCESSRLLHLCGSVLYAIDLPIHWSGVLRSGAVRSSSRRARRSGEAEHGHLAGIRTTASTSTVPECVKGRWVEIDFWHRMINRPRGKIVGRKWSVM